MEWMGLGIDPAEETACVIPQKGPPRRVCEVLKPKTSSRHSRIALHLNA